MPPLIFIFLLFALQFSSFNSQTLSCNEIDRNSLLSFRHHISSPLNWSSSDCCKWEGILCANNGGRVTRLSLPGRSLFGTLSPFLANLSFLSYLNLSGNHLSGSLPQRFFQGLNRLQVLDLSSNGFSGGVRTPQSSDSLPSSIVAVDLSNNRFNGSIDASFFGKALNLISFNVSNNSFTGPIPSSMCKSSRSIKILDFSVNKFSGEMFLGLGECENLEVLIAGFNSLSGWVPYDVYSLKMMKEISLPNNRLSGFINGSIVLLSHLTVLELHVNELSGGIPTEIGLLSNLEQVQLHTNNLNGTIPVSLANCTNLTTLLLRNNHFSGEITVLDFSKLQKLQTIDFGNNSFVGTIPESLCLCRSITAVRLAYNQFVGEVPSCMASLKSLAHLSLSDNYLSNVVGALKTLGHCENIAVLFFSRCFKDEPMPDDYDLMHLNGFQELQILTLGGCQLKGRIPDWISKLRKLKVLNLSYNLITGPIPTWLGSMPSLFVLNLTRNSLSGPLPREIGQMPALIADNSSSDLSFLALPFLFDSLQYNRLFNLPRGLKVGNNSLSGSIPQELGRLKLLHLLDLNDNNFTGSIPDSLSELENLERLDMSQNHLSGEIPTSLASLHFLSSFSVVNNDLEGEVPNGGQFDTFGAASFEGNPRLCGSVLGRSCPVVSPVDEDEDEDDEDESDWWSPVPFGMGYFVGFFAVSISFLFHSSCRCFGKKSDDGEMSAV